MKRACHNIVVIIIFMISSFIALPAAGNNKESNSNDTDPVKALETPTDKKNTSDTTRANFIEKFLIEYPEWERAEADNPDTVVTLRNGTCWFQLIKTAIPLAYYLEAVKNYVRENGGRIIQEERTPEYLLVYEMEEQDHVILAKAKAIRCEDHSYMAFFFCLKSSYDKSMVARVFNSIECERNWAAASRENRKLGLVLNPVDVKSIESFNDAYNMARDNNVQVSHHYVQWGDIERGRGEYDWLAQDFTHELIKDKGLEVSTVFNVIHTSVPGKIPGDVEYTTWDDPEFALRFIDFILKYVDRYQNTIRYVEIGNEVNIYFLSHPEELGQYRIFYNRVIDAVRARFPGVLTGTVFAYHTLKKHKQQRIYHSLSHGDFDAFTLYIYEDGFDFNHDPRDLFDWLEEIELLTGRRKYALEEVGWSTASSLRASEQDQAEAVNAFFDYLEQAPERLEYMSWFLLHDWSREEGTDQAGTFFDDPDKALEKTPAMDAFITFLIYLGLVDKDGTPKDGWSAWVKRAEIYHESP
jgi:hypothetical protein